MRKIELKATVRETTGKQKAKRLRTQNLVPCVLYGGEKNVNLSIHENELKKIVYTPHVYLIDLNIDGKITSAILKDIQFHPVTDRIIHVDFLEIFADKDVVIKVPVKLEGFAEGVKQGGKLSLSMRKLRVKGIPGNIPDELNIDITHLTLGKTVKIGDLNFEGIELIDPKNNVVAAVRLTRAARGMEAGEDEAEAGAEGEAEGGEEAASAEG